MDQLGWADRLMQLIPRSADPVCNAPWWCLPNHQVSRGQLPRLGQHLSEVPLAHRGNSLITDGPHQGRHPPNLIAECVLALLPLLCRLLTS